MEIHKVLIQLLVILVASTNAHFLINYPTSLGFNQNTEDEPPCGGASLSFTNTSDFHVGGDAIALTTLHPQSNFLFRVTTNQTGSSNWSVISLITEYGLGDFCEPALSVPAGLVGSMGLLQVVQNAEDGVHYQCAAVNFIKGVSSSIPGACRNSSGNSAAFISDSTLLPSGTSAPTASGPGSASTMTLLPSATSSMRSSAHRTAGQIGVWVIGILLVAFGIL